MTYVHADGLERLRREKREARDGFENGTVLERAGGNGAETEADAREQNP
ncbi:hypothetical protein [Haloprofundus salinisoli]|nr:hypothetical protein [Haloprofundus salinisoli]